MSPVASGGRGSDHLYGYACPVCARAIEDAGVVGWPARAQAVASYVSRAVSVPKAERLRSMLTEDFPPHMPAWGALGLRPSAEPWAYFRRVIDRLRAPLGVRVRGW